MQSFNHTTSRTYQEILIVITFVHLLLSHDVFQSLSVLKIILELTFECSLENPVPKISLKESKTDPDHALEFVVLYEDIWKARKYFKRIK